MPKLTTKNVFLLNIELLKPYYRIEEHFWLNYANDEILPLA
jgi:hypothetical protein